LQKSTCAKTLPFFSNYFQFTFYDLSSDENLLNNDTLNSFVVSFDNFCKNTHLNFDEHHKAEVTGACRGSCSSFQSS